MSLIDNIRVLLRDKYESPHRIPSASEVLSSVYNPETNSLNLSGGGSGSGTVESVNGQTGIVNLGPSDVDAIKGTRTDTFVTNYPSSFAYIDSLNTLPGDYYAGGTLALDTNESVDGGGSFRITLPSGGGLAGAVRAINANAQDYSNKNFSIWVRSTNWSQVNEIQIILLTGDSFNDNLGFRLNIKQYLVAPPNNEWIQLIFNREQFTTVGAANWDDIRNIIYRGTATGSNTPDIWFDQFTVYDQATQGYVSIDFDDGYEETWQAATYMSARGIIGSLHVIPELLGTAGYMTQAQVDDLARRGWDISAHGATQLGALTPEQIEQDMQAQRIYFREHAYKGADIYAYPEGVNNLMIRNIVGRYFSIGRDVLFISQPAVWVAPMNVHCYAPIESTTVQDLEQRIDDTVDKGTWQVIAFHRIVASPTGGSPTQYSMANFQSVIDHIVSSGAVCLPKSQVLSKLQ